MLDADDADEEVYSRIFSALRHGVRRRILRMLSKGKMTFTSMCDGLGITSSHLTYHLDALGELISKDDSGYALSVFGRAAVSMMSSVEDSPGPPPRLGADKWFKVLSAILMVVLIVVSGLYVDLSGRFREQKKRIEALTNEYEALIEKYKRLVGIPDLLNLTIKKPVTRISSGLIIVSGYNLEYRYDKDDEYVWYEDSATAIYSPLDNLTLKMYLSLNAPNGVYLPLTIQRGNAFLNESGVLVYQHGNYTVWQSPVIWSANASEWRAYQAVLPSKGWYTLSLVGPIEMTSSGALRYRAGGFGGYELWETVESIYASCDFRLLRDEEPVLFAVYTRWY